MNGEEFSVIRVKSSQFGAVLILLRNMHHVNIELAEILLKEGVPLDETRLRLL